MLNSEKKVIFSRQKKGKKGIANFLVILILLVLFVLIVFSFYMYIRTPARELKVQGIVEEAYLSEDGMAAYVRLVEGSNETNFTSIRFIMTSKKLNEYYYETEKSESEFAIRFRKTLWQWLVGIDASVRKYEYQINARDVGLNTLKDIREITATIK